MLPRKLKENEAGTVGLPIRIVVLSIIGFIGFYAILSAIGSAPTPPEPMYASANISSFFLPSPESEKAEETNLNLLVKVLDRNYQGIGEANVIVWSPDRKKAYSGITDSNGNATITVLSPELPSGKSEGYVAIKIMRDGYRDFDEEYFIKVRKS
jgi:hypothetical protein